MCSMFAPGRGRDLPAPGYTRKYDDEAEAFVLEKIGG